MEEVWIGLAVGAAVLLAVLVQAYNLLVRQRNKVREGWSGIEVQLKRRHDLVPPLVECVKAYQQHEEDLLEAVTRERSAAQAAMAVDESTGAAKELGRDLGRLVALA